MQGTTAAILPVMKTQLVELFIEELGTVIGGASPPSSGPGGNLAINEGGGNVQPGGFSEIGRASCRERVLRLV